MTCEFLKF